MEAGRTRAMSASTGIQPDRFIISKVSRDRKSLDVVPSCYICPRAKEKFIGGTSEGTVWKEYPVKFIIFVADNKNLKDTIAQDTDWREVLMRSLVNLPFPEVQPEPGKTRDLFRATIDPDDLYDEQALDKHYSISEFTVLYVVEEDRT